MRNSTSFYTPFLMVPACCIILMIACTATFAGNNKWREIKVDQSSLYVDSNAAMMEETTLVKHLAILHSLSKNRQSLKRQITDLTNATSNDSVSIESDKHAPGITYANLHRLTIERAIIDGNNIVRRVSFQNAPSRQFTDEEVHFNAHEHRIPPSYCTISEKEALEIAKEFMALIYGKEESTKFDSVSVVADYQTYGFIFLIKQKNDFIDWRMASVIIHANTGQIVEFSGDGRSRVDATYTPKISKSQALQMFNDTVSRLHANIIINKIGVERYSKRGKSRWAWIIFGARYDKNLGMSAHMFIDSETGEVFNSYMD